MSYQIRKPLASLLALSALLIAFMSAQAASAAYFRPQMIFVNSAPQQVDTNGDGRPETFSANYTVYADGTAEGEIFLDSDYKIIVQRGSIEIASNGELIVTAHGDVLTHEVGHTLTFHHQHTLPGNGGSGGGGDIVIFDIAGVAGGPHSFSAVTHLTIR